MGFTAIRLKWLLLLILLDVLSALIVIRSCAGKPDLAIALIGWTIVFLLFNVVEAAILALFRIQIWPYFVVNCFCSALVLWGCYFIFSYCAA